MTLWHHWANLKIARHTLTARICGSEGHYADHLLPARDTISLKAGLNYDSPAISKRSWRPLVQTIVPFSQAPPPLPRGGVRRWDKGHKGHFHKTFLVLGKTQTQIRRRSDSVPTNIFHVDPKMLEATPTFVPPLMVELTEIPPSILCQPFQQTRCLRRTLATSKGFERPKCPLLPLSKSSEYPQ